MRRHTILLCLFAAGVAGCARDPSAPEDGDPVTAFVAASTKEAVREVADAFQAERHIAVKVSADDSSKLALQITQDAPAQVFLSANEKWADFVKDKGYAHETKVLLGNALVIVTPKGNPGGVTRPEDLTKGGVRRVAVAGPTVPAGIYAREALTRLALWQPLEAGQKVVAGDNVRVTLAYVERGEAEAGIVYATDARISDKVEPVYTFDAGTHEPIRYPLVLLQAGRASASARAFFEYLQSHAAREVFAKHGFAVPDGR